MSIAPLGDMGKAPEGGWRTAPHPRAQAAAQSQNQGQNQGQVQGQNLGRAQGLGRPGPGPAAAPRRVNTTNFPYWPQSGDRDAPLPPYFPEGDEKRIVKDLALFGTLLDPADEENRWESGRFLGEGNGGRAILWTKLDENGSIIDVGHHLQCCIMLHY
jgi:hypothetical protein